ncbi:MAG TPA: ribulose-phosphate 3-epimerase [Eubacteriaceae bacterium]|nr:ribulose-phosphate 3-epimerase [Eubacteriaceae bacterium]
MGVKIAPSLFGADLGNLESQIKAVEECKVEMLHVDVMDGNFVPNIAFGPDQLKMLRDKTNLPFDVHMMVNEPDRFIERFVEAGAKIITVHPEATTHLHRSIRLIKSFGIKAGVVLNPATSVDVLKYVLDDIDMVLLMSVNPGYGGQSFLDLTLDKIKEVKEMIDGRDIDIQVDGGINLETAPKVVDAGANVLVAGSFTFKGDIKKNVSDLRDSVK